MDLNLKVDDYYLANVLCSGIESGIRYWCTDVSSTDHPSPSSLGMHTYYQPLVGGSITFEEDRSEEGLDPVYHTLDVDALKKGIQIILDNYPHHLGGLLGDSSKQDAITGDVLIQCAIFGHIKYG